MARNEEKGIEGKTAYSFLICAKEMVLLTSCILQKIETKYTWDPA